MLKAGLGYRFSDKVNIDGDLNQIVQGRNAGDFFYEANTSFLLSKSIGRIVLGAYIQNKSPEQMFERVDYQYHSWDRNFERSKISNLSFLYQNPKVIRVETELTTRSSSLHIIQPRAQYLQLRSFFFLETARDRNFYFHALIQDVQGCVSFQDS
jgi:hypothetical protein